MDERDELELARRALAVCRRVALDDAADALLHQALEYAPAAIGLLYRYDPECDIFRLRSGTIPAGDPGRSGLMALDLAELRGQGRPETWEAALHMPPHVLRSLQGGPLLAAPLAA